MRIIPTRKGHIAVANRDDIFTEDQWWAWNMGRQARHWTMSFKGELERVWIDGQRDSIRMPRIEFFARTVV